MPEETRDEGGVGNKQPPGIDLFYEVGVRTVEYNLLGRVAYRLEPIRNLTGSALPCS